MIVIKVSNVEDALKTSIWKKDMVNDIEYIVKSFLFSFETFYISKSIGVGCSAE